jgi:hypothetical protein
MKFSAPLPENPTRLIRADSQKPVQRVSWPSLDGDKVAANPVPLPTEPIVELLHQPDGSDKLIVTCSCGKRIEIKLEA